jgi:thermitase
MFTAALVAAIAVTGSMADSAVPGQALVKLGRGAGPGHVLNGLNVQVIDSIPAARTYLVTFSPDEDFHQKRSEMLGRQGVSDVWENSHVSLIETQQMGISFPDDNVPVHSAGTDPVPYYEQPAVFSINLDSALLITRGSGIRVAVIDNGYDPDHPLFMDGPVAAGYDFVDDDPDPSEMDGNLRGHGTFVAGLTRLAAPDCELMVVRAFDGSGMSDIFTVARAIDFAVAQNADVINMSFGTVSDHRLLQWACQAARDAGITLVASVGNAGLSEPVYPATYEGVIAVSAVDSLEVIAPFSNYGAYVDLCAPGVDVYSALPDPYLWGRWSGTSFSTPLVSATAALVKSVNTDGKCENLENHLRNTASTDLLWGAVNVPDEYYGYGLLDAFTAVLRLCLGDMDNSGGLNVKDLEAVARIVSTGEPPENAILRQADMNADGEINETDLGILSDLIFSGGIR